MIMLDVVKQVLFFHRERTGHDVQFKEEWSYKAPASDDEPTITLFGHSRFEQAHARIQFPDGSRYVCYLKSRNPRAPLEQQEAFYPQGKVKQSRWSGGYTLPPEKRQVSGQGESYA
jgi:hypothetical protein